jgi:hydrogenase large subunit
MVIGGHPLLTDVFNAEGSNVWSRQFARICRPATTLPQMKGILKELLENKLDPNLIHAPEVEDGEGYGLVEAARGALGHWVKIKNGKIEKYQIVAPTSWNSSPRDSLGNPGHWEKTFVGTKVEDIENPIEIEHVIRSHDACLVCTVHVLNTNKKYVYNL